MIRGEGRQTKALKSLRQCRQLNGTTERRREGDRIDAETNSPLDEFSEKRENRSPGGRALVTGQRKFTLCLAKRIRGIAIAKWTICHRFGTSSPDKERDSGLFRHFALPNGIAHNSARV